MYFDLGCFWVGLGCPSNPFEYFFCWSKKNYRYVSWVQNVVRQFGPYPVWALEQYEDLSLVREDREGHSSSVPVIVPTVNAG